MHVDWHWADETLPPPDDVEVVPDEVDELEDEPELLELDDEELGGPSPFVVEVQAARAAKASARAKVDFIPGSVAC